LDITVNQEEKKEILVLMKLLFDNDKITQDEYRRVVNSVIEIAAKSHT
jgi:hypothetical protein